MFKSQANIILISYIVKKFGDSYMGINPKNALKLYENCGN